MPLVSLMKTYDRLYPTRPNYEKRYTPRFSSDAVLRAICRLSAAFYALRIKERDKCNRKRPIPG